MAYADKMFFTKEEYKEIKKLWLKTRKKQKKELGDEIWMYPFSSLESYKSKEDGSIDFDNYEYKYDPSESDLDIESFPDDNQTYTVFNTSTRVELWLLKNFKLDCIKREVTNQLSDVFYQEIPDNLKFTEELIDLMDFSVPDCIYSIEYKNEDKNISLYFFTSKEKEITIYDKYIVFGTTEALEIINNAKKIIEGDHYNIKDSDKYTIQFSFCGLDMEFKDGKTYLDDREIVIPYIIPHYYKTKFIHSYNMKDVDKIKNNVQIIISGKNNIANLVCWVEADLKRILFTELPEYFRDLIKK